MSSEQNIFKSNIPSENCIPEEFFTLQHPNRVVNKAQQKMNNLSLGLSWHEHVYRPLSNRPTPHFIENILGIQNSSKCTDVEGTLTKSKMPIISDSLVSDCVPKLVSSQDLNEPLNLSIRSEKVRPKTNCKESVRKRKKPQELEAKIVSSTVVSPTNSLAEDGDSKKKKKARTTFTGRQVFELEKQFEVKKYLSSSERSEMAKLLNVTETQPGCALIAIGRPDLANFGENMVSKSTHKVEKIDNISNAEAAEHKNQIVNKNYSKPMEEFQTKVRSSKSVSHNSNSSIESDSKSSASLVTDSTAMSKDFKNILSGCLPLSPEIHFQTPTKSEKDVLLNLSFNVKDDS